MNNPLGVSPSKGKQGTTRGKEIDLGGNRTHDLRIRCNISKTSASVSSGVRYTEKVMKARGRRPSVFIVSRCLEPLMKHEARVFDMASQMKQ